MEDLTENIARLRETVGRSDAECVGGARTLTLDRCRCRCRLLQIRVFDQRNQTLTAENKGLEEAYQQALQQSHRTSASTAAVESQVRTPLCVYGSMPARAVAC